MKLKAAYDNFDEESNATGLKCADPSLTQQHDEPEANINNIVTRFLGTGTLETHRLPPLQGDFTEAPDMQTAMNLGIEARMAFMEQPAQIRSRFNNSAAEFVAFCSNPDNSEDMYRLGLLNDEANMRILNESKRREMQAKQDREDAENWRKHKQQQT